MTQRALLSALGAATLALGLPLGLPHQSASAAPAPCPDVDVVFARGTAEPPGLGITGTAFVESLKLQAGGESVGSYAVNYPASADFDHPIPFAATVLDGVRDAQAHMEATAKNCPGTKTVLGGYSQGAVVAGFATMAGMPAGVPPQYQANVPPPMPSDVADHVSAVVLFAKPSDRFMRDAGAPPIVLGPQYAPKAIEFCIPGDNICDGAPLAGPNALHVLYVPDAFTGAATVAGRI